MRIRKQNFGSSSSPPPFAAQSRPPPPSSAASRSPSGKHHDEWQWVLSRSAIEAQQESVEGTTTNWMESKREEGECKWMEKEKKGKCWSIRREVENVAKLAYPTTLMTLWSMMSMLFLGKLGELELATGLLQLKGSTNIFKDYKSTSTKSSKKQLMSLVTPGVTLTKSLNHSLNFDCMEKNIHYGYGDDNSSLVNYAHASPGLPQLGIKYYLGSLFRLSLAREKEVLFRKPLQALPNSLGNKYSLESLLRLSLRIRVIFRKPLQA
ncbi:hypothetical protein Fmac_011020 [Flemingia macrophylla]|uniref:Uncharacterized protein n=1 Tax=Flemingia macrophylla TaxID=520843 RepID=A0ABD1MLC6_9FABA